MRTCSKCPPLALTHACSLFLKDTTALSMNLLRQIVPYRLQYGFERESGLVLVGVSHMQLALPPTHNNQAGSSRASSVANNKIKKIRPQCLYFTAREFSIFDFC